MRTALLAIVTVCLCLLPVSGQQADPQNPIAAENQARAKALLQDAIAALGGQAFLTFQTRSEKGRTYGFQHGEPRGAGIRYYRFWRWPDKERLELTKDRDWIIIINGDQGYEVTFRGTTNLAAAEKEGFLRRREHSLETVLRDWVNDPGVAFFYDGPTIADERPVEQVTLMDRQHRMVTLYLDSTSRLPIKKTFTWRDAENQRNVEESEVYGNYRNVQGIQTAGVITRTQDGQPVNQRFIDDVQYNQPLADSLFAAHVGSKK